MCESLMLGDIPCNSSTLLDSNFENDFRLRWGERLAKFDDVISEYHPQEKLFDQVIVCGNLYAICKKLENLLRTSGLSEIIKQIHENDLTAKVPSNLTDSVSQSNQSTLLCANNHQEKSDEQAMIQPTVLDDTQVAADTGSQGLNEETSTVVTETDDQPLVLDVDNQVEINNAGDDDDDDALLPTSNDIFSIQKQLQSQQSISSKSTSLTMMPPPKPIPPKGTQMMKSKSNKRLVSSSSLSRTLSNNDKGVTTTPIFHNIAELFPAVHSLLRNIQKSGYEPSLPSSFSLRSHIFH